MPNTVMSVAHSVERLKQLVRKARAQSALAVNLELLKLYWEIGKEIVHQQAQEGAPPDYVAKLAQELRNEFPSMTGLSMQNLYRMRAFYNAYQHLESVEETNVYKIPWSHNQLIINKVGSVEERLWYVEQTFQHGWSRQALELKMKSRLYHRQGKAITNFSKTLSEGTAQLLENSLKDPYYLDFLDVLDEMTERDIEDQLVQYIQRFLEELGEGFAFVGRQVPVEVEGDDYYIDLLFFNILENRYYVIELKSVDFKPEFVGKLNFYLSVVDEQVKKPEHEPSIGLIICKHKKQLKIQYALRRVQSPIGVSSFETDLSKVLSQDIRSRITSIEEVEINNS